MNKFAKVFGTILLLLCSIGIVPIQAQEQHHNSAKAWSLFEQKSSANLLPDFSFAGYHHGETSPPDVNTLGYTVYDVTQYGAIPNDGRSDRAAVEAIIKKIGRGKAFAKAIIYFPEGDFILHAVEDDNGKPFSNPLIITAGHLVVKGAGQGKTTLTMTAPLIPKDTTKMWTSPVMLSLRCSGNKPDTLSKVTAASPKGSFSVTVNNADRIKAGDWVCLSLKNNSMEAIKEEVYPIDVLPKTMTNLIQEGVQVSDYHQVKDVQGNTVIFTEPLMHTVNHHYGWYILSYKHFEEVGVEDLTFVGNAPHNFQHHSSWLHDGGYKALEFTRMTNSWVRRVGFKSVSEALTFNFCANVSATHINIGGTRGHSAVRMAWTSRGFAGWIRDFSNGYLETDKQGKNFLQGLGQHHASGVSKLSMGNVFYKMSWGSDACFESHATQPRATLFDACEGAFLPFRMGGALNQLPNHLADLVIWNFHCTQTNGSEKPFEFWPQNNIWTKVLPPIIVGFHGKTLTFAPEQIKYMESPGRAVTPSSLYEAQLLLRRGKLPEWLKQGNR